MEPNGENQIPSNLIANHRSINDLQYAFGFWVVLRWHEMVLDLWSETASQRRNDFSTFISYFTGNLSATFSLFVAGIYSNLSAFLEQNWWPTTRIINKTLIAGFRPLFSDPIQRALKFCCSPFSIDESWSSMPRFSKGNAFNSVDESLLLVVINTRHS